MLKVKLETRTGENGRWHDLMISEGVDSAYQHLDDILGTHDDYIVSAVQSDWAQYDEHTALDDMIETVTELKKMMDDEVILFKEIYRDGTHEPMDIARSILQNEMKYIEDIDEDDEVWETVFLEKEQKTIAILE